jgi:hypothetical protein
MVQEKRHLFIFSFKLVIFFALLAGIVNLLTSIVPINRSEKIDTSFKHLLNTSDSVRYDVLFFSNSYIYSTIDPLYFEHLTGLKSLHFCNGAQRTLFTIETIKYILGYYKPSCIIMDLSKSSTLMPADRKSWSFTTEGLLSIDLSLFNLLHILTFTPKKERANVFFDSYSNFTATLYNLNRWKEYHQPTVYPRTTGYLGFNPLTQQKDEIKNMSDDVFNKTYYNSKAGNDTLFDFQNQTGFYNYLQEFAQSGVKVIFVSSLKLNSVPESGFEAVADSIVKISPENYIPVNLNDPEVKKLLALTHRDFMDHGHLLHSGALKVTAFIARKVNGILVQGAVNEAKKMKRDTLSEFIIRGHEMILEDYFQKTLQLYFEKIPENYIDSSMFIRVFKSEIVPDKSKADVKKSSQKPDITYLNKNDFLQIDDTTIIATVFLKTSLKKDQIGRVEISLIYPGMPEITKPIYQSGSNISE